MRKVFQTALIAMGLAFFAPNAIVYAETQHSHDGAVLANNGLHLIDGKKWRGDASMIKGMAAIHALISTRKTEIHNNVFDQQDYAKLAASIHEQITFMAQNCNLPEAVDQQFHVVLGDVISGVEMMEAGQEARQGAVKVILALNAYGKHFEHPGWQFF